MKRIHALVHILPIWYFLFLFFACSARTARILPTIESPIFELKLFAVDDEPFSVLAIIICRDDAVDIQRCTEIYDLSRLQFSPVVREAMGVSRLLSKPRKTQGRKHCESNPSGSWGDWVANIIDIVSEKNFGIEEGCKDIG